MIPKHLTSLKADDILEGSSDEYRIGEQASLVGWMKEFFLFGRLDDGKDLDITTADRKHYNEACNILRGHAKMSTRKQSGLPDGDLYELEEKVTRKKAASLINLTVKDFINGRNKPVKKSLKPPQE